MRIFYGNEYHAELLAQIAKAQQSITLAAMVYDAEEEMVPVMIGLETALHRGVQVTLYIDAFTRLRFYEKLRPIHGYRQWRHLQQWLARLESEGAHIIWLGALGANPYKRRFHQKISIFDAQEVFFAGGINLTSDSFHFHDYMIHARHPGLAEKLADVLVRIAQDQYISDEDYTIDHNHTAFIDGGKPGSSIIYDQALRLAKESTSIIFVSQMAPSGRLAAILAGKPVTYYLNSPFAMSPLGGVSDFITQKRHRYHNTYAGSRYIHAKYMLFTMPNGTRIILTGSHNFNERGVRYGTKEIALLAKDDALWSSLHDYTTQRLTRSEPGGS